MVNTPASQQFRGGDTTQLKQTAAVLRQMGVEVEESYELEPDGRGFDLAHIFNLRTLDATERQVQSLKHQGLPVVMSPIYLNISFPLWGTRVIENLFNQATSVAQLAQGLTGLKNHTLRINRQDGQVFAADTKNRQPDYDLRQRRILDNIDYLLPNSILEMDQLARTLRVGNIPFSVVPYAADPAIFLDPDPTSFIQEYGLQDFVLQVGRLELSKNQVMLAYALKELELPVVFIGGNMQPNYIEWCKRYGPKQLKIISHLPPEMLRSAYAAARIHVLPSWIETCGLVTMEAALANCSVVASIAGYEREYYRDLAYYCDPADVDDIRQTVIMAWEQYQHDLPRRQKLKELILQDYTWERAAAITLQAYQQVLGAKETEN